MNKNGLTINSLKQYLLLVHRESKIRKNERKRFLSDAEKKFKELDSHLGSLKDYKRLLYKHRFSYDEYLRYKLYSLSRRERNAILSTCEMNSIYRKFVHDKVRKVFVDKTTCLVLFNKWVRRKWCLAKETSYEDFVTLVSSKDCIVKPINGECGKGIFKIKKEDNIDYAALYETCKANDMLIEECVYACEEIERFHPSSLNTIRVVTMSNQDKCAIIGAALRMGVGGSIIDNIGGGGVFVPVEVGTGVIRQNAIDSYGNEYEAHPDTSRLFKGTQIPHWSKVVECVTEASKLVDGALFTGWDICILPSGEVELIEANSAPDIIAIQFVPNYEKKFLIRETGIEMTGLNLLRLTSIWSKSYRIRDNN